MRAAFPRMNWRLLHAIRLERRTLGRLAVVVPLSILAAGHVWACAVALNSSGASSAQMRTPELRFVVPRHDDVVNATMEIRLRAAGVTEDIHLLAMDAVTPTMYRHLGRIAAPRAPGLGTLSRLVDTTGTGVSGVLRLVAVSTNSIVPSPAGEVDGRAIPGSAPMDEIEVRHAATIVAPLPGAYVGPVDSVRAQGFLPDTYVAAVVKPASDGGYWVQNNGVRATLAASQQVRVHFGGRGLFHLYLGVTFERELFREGDRRLDLPDVDQMGRPVYWVGPVEVRHQ